MTVLTNYRYLVSLVTVPIHCFSNLVYTFTVRLPLVYVSLASSGKETELGQSTGDAGMTVIAYHSNEGRNHKGIGARKNPGNIICTPLCNFQESCNTTHMGHTHPAEVSNSRCEGPQLC